MCFAPGWHTHITLWDDTHTTHTALHATQTHTKRRKTWAMVAWSNANDSDKSKIHWVSATFLVSCSTSSLFIKNSPREEGVRNCSANLILVFLLDTYFFLLFLFSPLSLSLYLPSLSTSLWCTHRVPMKSSPCYFEQTTIYATIHYSRLCSRTRRRHQKKNVAPELWLIWFYGRAAARKFRVWALRLMTAQFMTFDISAFEYRAHFATFFDGKRLTHGQQQPQYMSNIPSHTLNNTSVCN